MAWKSTHMFLGAAVHVNSSGRCPLCFASFPAFSRINLSIEHQLPTWPGADDKDEMGLDSISDPEEVADRNDPGLDRGDVLNAFPACGLGISSNHRRQALPHRGPNGFSLYDVLGPVGAQSAQIFTYCTRRRYVRCALPRIVRFFQNQVDKRPLALYIP
ncbi:hypothetical protein B0H14DRAFT_1639218 [Mycena olivaceomarginata]|nr:hypothetical protein B0H14DRAFT_1639218 [Mycena olivaceomarginata]